ncbi:MAG: HD domain-containing protein [Mobilicoccus sp.]|nr:HD domain-containing protein [Mobilicoccus sp.]
MSRVQAGLLAPATVVVLALAAAITWQWRRSAEVGTALTPENGLLVVFFLTIIAGATVHAYGSDYASRLVDVGGTAALALAVTYALPSGPVDPGTPAVIAVTVAGLVGGGLIAAQHLGATASLVLRRATPRCVAVAALSLLWRDVPWGESASLSTHLPGRPGTTIALALFILLFTVVLIEAPLRATLLRREGEDWVTGVYEELRESVLLGAVPASTAVIVVVAQPLLGLPALPVLLLPLVFNQVAVRRHDEARRHSSQSVLALSRMPEAMGLVRRGHALRVASTAADIGRELGLTRRELAELNRAALLHDIGQVYLSAPVPSGATVLAAPADQANIAEGGGSIARATGVLEQEAAIIDGQFVPYHRVVSHARSVPLASRIIKVANAYDDLLTGASGSLPVAGPDAALERVYLGMGHEYDPRVVEALARVLGSESGAPPTADPPAGG